MNIITLSDLRVWPSWHCSRSHSRYRSHFLCVASFGYAPDYSLLTPPLIISFFFFFFLHPPPPQCLAVHSTSLIFIYSTSTLLLLSLPLARSAREIKCLYSITGRWMCRVSIRFHVLVNKCCQLPYARVLDSPDNTRVARHRVQTVQFSHTEAEGTVWTVTLLARTQPMSVYTHMQAH